MAKVIMSETVLREYDSERIWEGEGGCLHMYLEDAFPQNPRMYYDNLFNIVCDFGRQGNYSDDGLTSASFIEDVHMALRFANMTMPKLKEYSGFRGLTDYVFLMRQAGGFASFIYGISHSGLHISLSPFADMWDTGVAGLIWLGPDVIKEFFAGGKDSPAVLLAAKAEIRELDSWLSGDMYYVKTWEPSEWKRKEDGSYEVTANYDVDGGYLGVDDVMAAYPPKIKNVTT